jgi:hypothetical protein
MRVREERGKGEGCGEWLLGLGVGRGREEIRRGEWKADDKKRDLNLMKILGDNKNMGKFFICHFKIYKLGICRSKF